MTISLALAGNGLDGTLPTELGDQALVKKLGAGSLDLSSNHIGGSVPSQLGV